jgi:amino acid adenylation domain-containing protein
MQRMVGHFQMVLESIVADPDQRLWDVAVLTAAENHQLLAQWNATQADGPRHSIMEMFQAQVERTPAARAVSDEQTAWSYEELDQRASEVGRALRRLGVGPEVPVGVCLPRSVQTLVALLGIWKAGGVYVPLDPAYPAAHLQSILQETAVPVLLVSDQVRARLPEHPAPVVRMDRAGASRRRGEEGPLETGVRPENLAYVMYTSGSTGQPKGVAVEHKQLLNRLGWMWRAYPFEPGEVLGQRTTVNFSVSMWELVGGLLQGVETVILSDEVGKDPGRLIDALARHQVTRLVVVPSLLRAMLETEPELGRRLPQLKLWSVCGEPLTVELWRRFVAQVPGARLLNQYGASEMNDVSWSETSEPKGGPWYMPIGRPISNTQVYVLDRELRPAPIGVVGEIHVSSGSPARGYVKRPELTAEKFIPHPFSGEPGARLYKMGDLGRYIDDGQIEYVGRRDHQVKIRGMRVEMKGVEAVLMEHEAVKQAVVVAREEKAGERRLVGYVVGRGESGLSQSELRRYLEKRLPEYMIPSTFLVLEALPLTPNGKVNRQALPEPEGVRPELEVAYVAPQTELERIIAAIWQEVLGVEKVGVHDNFFDLGGNSLAMVQVRGKLRAVVDQDISVIEMFQYPTVSALSQYLSHQHATQQSMEPPSFEQIHDRAKKQKEAINRQKQFFVGGQRING